MGLAGILPFLQQYAQQSQALPPGGLPPQTAPTPQAPPQAAPPDPSQMAANVPPAAPQPASPAPIQPAVQPQTPPPAAPAPPPVATKGHKLLAILQMGIQGALDGQAANAETYQRTGRSGGFGAGVGGAIQAPLQRAQQQAQTAQVQQQTAIAKSEQDPVNVPGLGTVPGFVAKSLGPSAIRAYAAMDVESKKAASSQSVAQTGAAARTGVAQIGAQGRTGAAQIGADARIKAAQMGLGPMANVSPELQQQLGLPAQLPLRMLNQAESAANKPLTIAEGEAGPSVVNKQTGATKNLGLGAPAQSRVVQAAQDPSNPGNISYMSAGQAIRGGAAAPGSAPSITAKATAKAVAPGGKVGEEVNAFNVAIRHADLLSTAAEALHNGDTQTLNGLKNRFKNEFGSTEPITANTIAGAYTREVTKMLSGGHMTDSEIGTVGSTLDTNRQSLPQMMGVLNAYKALAASKMQVRQQAVQQGMQGKANFPSAQGPPQGATHTAMGSDGKRHYINAQGQDFGIAQ